MFKLKNNEDRARTGVFKTYHFKTKTPFYMPVATKADVKYMASKDLVEQDVQAIISNAFILEMTIGSEIIKKHNGIHKMMDFPRTIFTDSGGFQILSPELLIKIDDRGAYFKDPFNGKKHLLKPEDSIRIQNDIGSDVAMVLDHVTFHDNKKDMLAAVKRTTQWAQRCIKFHEKNRDKTNKKQMLFGISQGGVDTELRKKSIKEIASLNFDGHAYGGLGIGEKRKEMFSIIKKTMKYIPEDIPVYLMGVGSPIDMIEAVSLGIDCFDSVYPTRNARHCSLFTWNGELRLRNSKYKEDLDPIDKRCNCYVCKNFSRSYLRHLLKQNSGLGKVLATYHNIYFMQQFMKKIQNSIARSEFKDFKKEFLKDYKVNNKKKFKKVYS